MAEKMLTNGLIEVIFDDRLVLCDGCFGKYKMNHPSIKPHIIQRYTNTFRIIPFKKCDRCGARLLKRKQGN